MRIVLLTLFLSLLIAVAVDGWTCQSCAQTVQRIGTSAREYGASLGAGVPGTRPNQIQVGTTIPYVTMNREAPQSSPLLNGGSSGLQTPPNFGSGFGINPLLRGGGGGSGGPVISQPNLPPGPGSFQRPVTSRPQAYNPYTGRVYGQSQPQANRTATRKTVRRPAVRRNPSTTAQNARSTYRRAPSSSTSRKEGAPRKR